LASNLPSFILDALISLPHFLISVRNGLLPAAPKTIPVDQPPSPVTQQQNVVTKTHERPPSPPQAHVKAESVSTVTTQTQDEGSSSGDEMQSNPSSYDDADIESNTGDASVVESSWVNLHEKHD